MAEALGRDLAAARRAAGLTQAELAKRIGTTQAAVARLERGRVEPTVRTMSRLADVLQVTFEVTPGSGLTVRPAAQPVTMGQLRARRGEILRAMAAAGARNPRVFGSVSRGDAGPGSDVDIVVELEAGRTLMDLGGLQLDLEDLLGTPVHVITLPRTPPKEPEERRVLERIEREALPL